MNKNLLILGAGGHGSVVRDTAVVMGKFRKVDFLDDNSEVSIGKCLEVGKFINEYTYAFVAFGDNKLRMKWLEKLTEEGFRVPVLIHPTAYVSSLANIQEGSVVCAKAVVNTNARVKRGSIISIGALVDHDSVIGEYSHINSGAIVKAGCKVERLKKIDAGAVYFNKDNIVGV